MSNFRSDNKFKMLIFISIMLFLFSISFLFPFWIISYFKFSGVKHFLDDNYLVSVFFGFLFSYLLIVGQYFYNVYIDNYVLKITSYRPFSYLFSHKNYVDISHSMLVEFSFFSSPFTFNKILMLKIRSDKKIVIKRFNLTFITNKEVLNLSRSLDKIIENNK